MIVIVGSNELWIFLTAQKTYSASAQKHGGLVLLEGARDALNSSFSASRRRKGGEGKKAKKLETSNAGS